MTIQRERYGRFGIASAPGVNNTGGYWAWGCLGDTVADNAVLEPSADVWFQHAESREKAIALLKEELGRQPAELLA